MKVTLKSAYLPYETTDGARYLVETLWPEGVDAFQLLPYLWMRELSPSYNLKEMAVWKQWSTDQFRDEYRKELQLPGNASLVAAAVSEARQLKGVTLLHRSRKKPSDVLPEDTSAFYLKEFLDSYGMELEQTGLPEPQRLHKKNDEDVMEDLYREEENRTTVKTV